MAAEHENGGKLQSTTEMMPRTAARIPWTEFRESRARRACHPGATARGEKVRAGPAMPGKTSGNASAPTTGNVNIAPGTNVAATTDTASRKIVSVPILAVDIGFASTTYPSSWSTVPRVSSSEACGSAWLIPCPETWSPVWYRTDDVYVDYVNDGYYMFNRQHPGIAIAVNVSL